MSLNRIYQIKLQKSSKDYELYIELIKPSSDTEIFLTYLYKTEENIRIGRQVVIRTISHSNVPNEAGMDEILFKISKYVNKSESQSVYYTVVPTKRDNAWLFTLNETNEDVYKKRLALIDIVEMKLLNVNDYTFDLELKFSRVIPDYTYWVWYVSEDRAKEQPKVYEDKYTIESIPIGKLPKPNIDMEVNIYRNQDLQRKYKVTYELVRQFENKRMNSGLHSKATKEIKAGAAIDKHLNEREAISESNKEKSLLKEVGDLKERLNNLNSEYYKIKSSNDKLIKENESIKQLSESINNKNKILEEKLNNFNDRVNELNQEKRKLEEEKKELNREITERDKNNKELIESISKYKKDIDELKKIINENELKLHTYSESIGSLKSVIRTLSKLKNDESLEVEQHDDETITDFIDSIKLARLNTKFYQLKYNFKKVFPESTFVKISLISKNKRQSLYITHEKISKEKKTITQKISINSLSTDNLNDIKFRIALFKEKKSNIIKTFQVTPKKENETAFTLRLNEIKQVTISKINLWSYQKTFRLGVFFTTAYREDSEYYIIYNGKKYFPSAGSSQVTTDQVPLGKFPMPGSGSPLFFITPEGDKIKYLIYADPESSVSPQEVTFTSLSEYLQHEVKPVFSNK